MMDATFLAMGLSSGIVLGGAFVGGSLVLSSFLLFLPGLLWHRPLSFLDVSAIVGAETVIAAGTAAATYRDVVRVEIAGPLLVPAAVMAAVGAVAAPHLPRSVIFSLLFLVVCLSIYRLARHGTRTASPPPGTARWQVWGVGAGVGFLSGLYGIGGGFLMVPALMLRGLETRTAIGNTMVVGASMALVGLLTKAPYLAGHPFPLWPSVLVLLGATVGAQAGAWIGRHAPESWMRRVVLILLVMVAVRIGLSV